MKRKLGLRSAATTEEKQLNAKTQRSKGAKKPELFIRELRELFLKGEKWWRQIIVNSGLVRLCRLIWPNAVQQSLQISHNGGIRRLGMDIVGGSPEDATKYVMTQAERVRGLIKAGVLTRE